MIQFQAEDGDWSDFHVYEQPLEADRAFQRLLAFNPAGRMRLAMILADSGEEER